MADAAEAGRLAVGEGEEEEAVRRHQVGGRPGGDLGIEVDSGVFAVVDQRAVGLADEVGVELQDPRIVALDRLQGEGHGNDANALQNFSNLRATRMDTPGRILSVTQKEMEASIRESVARAEAARAGVEVAREGIEVARRKQEEATAEQKALTAKLERQWAKADARWQKEQVAMREYSERQEKMLQEGARKTDEIIAELRDARDERRAMLEALLRVMDRLPPPPPNLRSA
jgi:hypothetical protein